MGLLAPPPRAEDACERLDGAVPIRDRAESLDDVARLNVLFGGRRVALGALALLADGLPPGRPFTVVDVGTGSADLPRAIVRWGRRAGRPVRVLAVDRDEDTLAIAHRRSAGYPEITLVRAEAAALPIAPAAADVVMSALTLHHLEPAEAVAALGEMAAAARVGVAVNDLSRSRHGALLVGLVTRALAASPLSRHDGPLSVRRAYTPAEALALCEKAGVFGARLTRHPFLLRWALAWSTGHADRSRP
jgi:hypothetical protein